MYQMIKKELILKLLETKGPSIPVHMKRELGASDTIILGAILSELVSEGKVKITSTRIGGSPAYYVPGGEAMLDNLIKYLNEKDKRTAELLQQKKVLRDSEQTPLVRVGLRTIKDFAKPLEVNVKGQKEIYWKWHNVTTSDAEQLIMKKEKLTAPVAIEKKAELEKIDAQEKPALAVEAPTPVIAAKVENKAEVLEKEKPIKEEKEPKKQKPAKEKKAKQEPQAKQEVQQTIIRGGAPSNIMDLEKDAFFRQIRAYLEKNEISILDYKIIKKTEIDLTVSVPSKIGTQEYYCKAKSKKKVNDGDLSSAYMQGQSSKLPILFLTNGELTKRAKEMLTKEFKGMTVKTV